MKRLYLFGAIALMAVALAASPAVNAQENGNRDENGKIARGPYLTNEAGDNWFISISGGVNGFWNDGYKFGIGPSIDASFGKWFTPDVGMRVGYSGFTARAWSGEPSIFGRTPNEKNGLYANTFGYMYIHGDLLWNASNTISGYKETRFWNVSPYLNAGFYRSYGINKNGFAENELAVGAGILHNLRLTNRMDLIIDMKAIVVDGRVIGSSGVAVQPSVTMGFSVDLGFPNFVRASTVVDAVEAVAADNIAALQAAAVALELANANLEDDMIGLQQDNRNLTSQVKQLRKKQKHLMDVAEFFKEMGGVPVYFNIGKTTLTKDEMAHLDFIARNIVAKADKCPKIYITVMGSADGNTGSAKRNAKLSAARGQYVADILTTKYGISKDKIVVKSEVVKTKTVPELARAVKIIF